MKCINCLHCKLKIDTKESKYYLGYYCSKEQLHMQQRAYALTKQAVGREVHNCRHYDPMEESLDWIDGFKKSLLNQVVLYDNPREIVLNRSN